MADTSSVEFDKKEQFDQIVPWLLPSERLYAVFDCKGASTGFIAVTDKRLMFYDKAMLRKKKALTSVPFSKITSVSSVDEGGMFRSTSELIVKTGSEEFEFEFRGGDKAQRAYQLIMMELLEQERAAPVRSNPSPMPITSAPPDGRLVELERLRDEGILTAEEYDAKRREHLNR